MKLSIVIPCYNNRQYVGQALASALAQDEPDCEIIVLDNASTDDSADIVRSFSDPRLRHIRHKENIGMIGNFSYGLNHTSGDFISFLCADDFYAPNAMGTLFALHEKRKDIAFAYGRTTLITDNSIPKEMGQQNQTELLSGQEFIDTSLKKAENPAYLSSVLSRRQSLLDCGGILERDGIFFDWNLWLRAACQGWVARSDKQVAVYRLHSGNQSKTLKMPSQTARALALSLSRGIEDKPEFKLGVQKARQRIYANYAREILWQRQAAMPWKSAVSELWNFLKLMTLASIIRNGIYMAAALLPVRILKLRRKTLNTKVTD